MIRLSANLGFLWTELDLPEAIQAAATAGFHGVECHFPYAIDSAKVKAAMSETGLPMVGLNTHRGNVEQGDNGLSAVIGRESEARDYIEQAVEYAAAIECKNVHVMAGFTDQGPAAENTFCENLSYACELAAKHNVQILIEPLNHYDAPGYHLNNLDSAIKTMETVSLDNIKVMFDCYHIQLMQGDLTRRLEANLSSIGHIQFAAVPDRGEPDLGEVHYPNLLSAIDAMGWDGYLGAEYKPRNGNTEDGLAWMKAYK
jgi:hydroxypyruvate isomerase